MAKVDSYKPILDYWSPPKGTTADSNASNPIPISFITTTFTFDAEFFDEECLSRFLTMETEKENDGVAFLIEREEKLASLHSGLVLVDQNHCTGARSLRWDLIPCRLSKGVMHSKITILQWSNCIRLIIGSANLTKCGYCINQEIFGVIDYFPGSNADLKVISDVLVYLREMTRALSGELIRTRFKKIDSELRNILKKWGISERTYAKDEIRLQALFVSPGRLDALNQLKNLWEKETSLPPDKAYITSPFFDTEEYALTPSKKILDILDQNGKVKIEYNLTTEVLNQESDKIVVNAPSFLNNINDPTLQSVSFKGISEEGKNENGNNVARPLHLKSVWLCNNDLHLYQIGSSNFTSAGLGLVKKCNYEANLVYCISESANKKAYRLLEESYIDVNDLDSNNLIFKSRPNDDESLSDPGISLLPACFGEVVFRKDAEKSILELTFTSKSLPDSFEIRIGERSKSKNVGNIIYTAEQWELDEQKLKVCLEWTENFYPDFLLVRWKGANDFAWWPVLLESQLILPPVEELRNLPLEVLVHILSSSQPLHRLMKVIERFQTDRQPINKEETIVDALQLVDSSGFLLQRTRRVSFAINALCERLQRPVFTKESLNWRLNGPVGVRSLIDAIKKESRSEEEIKFLLAEIALELSRVQPSTTEISLKKNEIKLAIRKLIQEIAVEIQNGSKEVKTDIENYSIMAFNKALNDL